MKKTEELAADILRVQGSLESSRTNFESQWQEISQYVWPDRAEFTCRRTEGDKRMERVNDSTGILSLTRFAAAMESMITPRTQRWHHLAPKRAIFRQNKALMEWLEGLTEVLFARRYAPQANFASQSHENYLSIGAFGNGCIFVEHVPGSIQRYKAIPLAELYFLENAYGTVDYVHRKFRLTARQALDKFGGAWETAPSFVEKVRTRAAQNPGEWMEVLHCTRPQTDPDSRFPFASVYVSCETREVLEIGGYIGFPYALGRYITTPGETYGRGVGNLILPDIKMIQDMSRSILRAGQLVTTPPLLLPEDGALRAFDMRSGALNYGGLDDRGNPRVVALQTGAQLPTGEELLTDRRKSVQSAFLIDLFQILVQQPYVTATESLERAREKGQLLAPTMGRIQAEQMSAVIRREIDIAVTEGDYPQMPEEVFAMLGIDPLNMEAFDEPHQAVLYALSVISAVEFDSPLNRMQKTEEAIGTIRTLEALTPLAQVDPKVLTVINAPRAARVLAAANGMPLSVLRSEEEVAAMEEEARQMAEAQQMLAAAPVAAQTAKTLAETQNLAMTSPQQVAR